jgi:homoserine kinase
MMNQLHSVKAFAPATSANVAVGFDILGFAVADLGDEVTLVKSAEQKIKITSISCPDTLSCDLDKNTATVAVQAMLRYLNLNQGFHISIKKNIPLSSGLGGSAASSVAALVALNKFLIKPLTNEQLIEFALMGEEAACGAKHGDNVIPCLFGGMTLLQSLSPIRIIALPVLPLHVVLIHPHLRLDTREARAALKHNIRLSVVTKQNANLAAFISALYEQDYERLEAACIDELIEPMRAHLIPYFYEVKAAAYQEGALACSISGSGPTLFAFAKTAKQARKIAEQMTISFNKIGIPSDTIITTISSQGARVIDEH